jgi:hypothetical protein
MKRLGFRHFVVAVAALVVTLGVARRAEAFTHIVQPGESLAQIAARVYGDPKYETVLVGANALDVQGGSAIASGMRLEIPAPGHVKVTRETWSDLALTWLGDLRRADVLARANDAVSWVPPEVGRVVRVPAVVTHIAAEGDTMDRLARRYLADANKAWEIDAYNFRKPNTLRRGDVVLVPLADLTLTAAGRAEAERAEGARAEGDTGTHDAQRRADAELAKLLAHVSRGRYVDAVALGNRLLGGGQLIKAQVAAISRALLEAYVALEAPGAATAACEAWKSAAGADAHLDARTSSPKLRAACH